MPLMRTVLALAVTGLFAQSAIAQSSQDQQQSQQQSQQQRRLTVADLRGQPLHDQSGQRLGQIQEVVLDQNQRGWLVISQLGGQEILAPFNYLALRNGRYVMVGATQMDFERYDPQATGMQRLQASDPVRVAGYDRGVRQSQAEAARIVIRDPEPRVRIEQAQPSVRVQQPQPQVTVDQARPQIIVRQPPPTITVQQEQPEIIVRMPEPDVNVRMSQPEVQVNVPPPQVRFADGERQARVAPTVERAEPQVQVVPPRQEAQVDMNTAQPQVRFERTGEPQVRYAEPQGEPRIRYEQMGQEGRQARTGEQGSASAGGSGQSK